MPYRSKRRLAALAGLALILLGGVAHAGPTATPTAQQPANVQAKAVPAASNGLSAFERQSLSIARAANDIASGANRISETQRRYALWQLVLASFGVLFAGSAAFFAWRATFWAKEAAGHASTSARADNQTLEEARKAAIAAREEAAEQAARFKEQMDKTEQLVAFTAMSANAMDDTATAMRQMAQATHDSVEAADKNARATLAPYVYAKSAEPYLDATGVRVLFECLNAGQTPATFFAVGCVAEIVPLGTPPRETLPDDLEYTVWTALGGGASKTAMVVAKQSGKLDLNELNISGGHYFRVVGRIIYGDIFGMAYETNFIFFQRADEFGRKMSQAVGDMKVFSPMASWESLVRGAKLGSADAEP